MTVIILSYTADASPLMTGHSPSEPIASEMSLLHRVIIYAKEGSRKLIDGRWNLSKAKSKLGISLSEDETKQLMACTGKIVCSKRGSEVFASASSVLRPDLLVTAKHVFSSGRGGAVSPGWCSFRSFLHRKTAIPIVIEKDQRKGYFLNNEDFIVVRLKRELKGCNSFALNATDSSLAEGDEIFSATAYQRRSLNRLSSREPVLAKGTIRNVSKGFFGGPSFYYGEIDLDEGGSGGAVFALKDGRPVVDDQGRIVLRGILVAHGPRARNGRPYSEDRNYTIIIGVQEEFRDLVQGKAFRPPDGIDRAPCLEGEVAKIEVLSSAVSLPPPEPLMPAFGQDACGGEAASANATTNCKKLTKEMRKLAKQMKTMAPTPHAKRKREYRLKNGTSCPICFTYRRCTEYGCWDEMVRASGKSTLFVGVNARAPVIKNPQFCASGRRLADWTPPLPLRRPEPVPPLPSRKPIQALASLASAPHYPVEADAMSVGDRFLAAKEKANRQGVWTLRAEDIRGLSLKQITELRGY